MGIGGAAGSFLSGIGEGYISARQSERDAMIAKLLDDRNAAPATPASTATPPMASGATPSTDGGATPRSDYDPSKAPSYLSASADKYGIDPEYLNRVAWIESKFNPAARNQNSSAGGLFQFTDSTAKNYGLADKFSGEASADAGARLAVDNRRSLTGALGRDPTGGELYLAHQQGAAGAAQLLRNPNAPAISIVGRNALLNNGGNANMSASDFANLWTRKYEALGGVPKSASATPRSITPTTPSKKTSDDALDLMGSLFPQRRGVVR